MELRSLGYAVVDVETTGTRSGGEDRVMEIAVIHVDDGVVTTAVDVLVNPQRSIPPFVSRLTNIHRDMVCEAPTFGDIADLVHDALQGRVFVAHNARFDWRFLSTELRRATGRPPTGQQLCTVRFARRLLPYLRRRSLDWLAWHYEVEIVGRHRAGGDARATARILQRMLADARRLDVDTWDQLTAFMLRPKPDVPRYSALPRPVTDEAIA